MKTRYLCLLFPLLLVFLSMQAQKQFIVKSPNGKLQLDIYINKANIEYQVTHNGDLMIAKSALSLTLTNGKSYGIEPKLSSSSKKSINQTIQTSIYKRKQIVDNCNELTLNFKKEYNIIFRAYNEGVAYRFVSLSKEPFIVENEQAEFNFPADEKAYIAYVVPQVENPSISDQYFNSFENVYTYIPLSQWDKSKLALSPLVVEGKSGKKVCITEADLLNYPGMHLHNADGSTKVKGSFAPYPKSIKQGGYRMLQGAIEAREPYIAKYEKGTSFPWRIIAVSENDYELADNDLVYKLATPTDENFDFSWVKPGKVAWDWWNNWNLYNVDFETGVNNTTYKYYIDFASKHGIEYVILDEGWSVKLEADLMKVVPEIDLQELVGYARSKNVGLILWAGYYAFNRDIEAICKHYSEMGIKGFKVDFMDRDDQIMVDFHHRASKIAAKYKMLLDFHGSYKPTGLQRTYPNAINFEGVHGLETSKFKTNIDQVTYDVTIPFIRMIAGPMDYTQGAMRNAIKENFRTIYTEPMSQGTRCRQLAEYIIFESPLNMLCDSPSNYMSEPECTEFITSIPTTWDNTIALNGKIAQYITIARQKGDIWYVGSLTNWNKLTLDIDLSFLGDGNFEAEIFRDGANANKVAEDYKKEIIKIPSGKKLSIQMAPGGGHVMKIHKLQ